MWPPSLDTTSYLETILYLRRVAVNPADVRRRSRSETQALTRERLLDAAEDAFAAEGFGGASLDRIADAAGLTRGAIYSNFTDKADLFAAVLDRRLERRAAEIADAIADAGDPGAFVDAMRRPEWDAGRADEAMRWAMLYDEYRLFALRNPAARERLAQSERLERDRYVEAIRHFTDQLGVALPVDERLAAAMLLALDQSLWRQHRLDPDDVPGTAFAEALDVLLRAAVALAPAPPRPRRRRRSG
jgi:AcrR family transcriptional regulator